jgi:hypothetical protein
MDELNVPAGGTPRCLVSAGYGFALLKEDFRALEHELKNTAQRTRETFGQIRCTETVQKINYKMHIHCQSLFHQQFKIP